jgi:hypothetical protein
MKLINIENNVALLNADISKQIAEFEKTIKEIKEKEDNLKQAILDEMESKGIVKIDTDDLTINYIASGDRETFDSKTFREDHADLYDEYIKFTPVKSSIRIKLK